jgi:anti-sigma regulatory factor (Ser/Thr protein kinase)
MDLAPHDHDPVRVDADQSQAMVVFARDIDTAGAARTWLLQFLRARGWPDIRCQDAELVISELVTNALRHGLGEIVVRGSLTDDDELQVSVTDSGQELPEIQPIDPDRVGGVGLRIVDRLATDWGVASFPGGKTVWAILVTDAPG